jgi:ABC-type bacteriocin/lantibiotic exporter with double-glycine peptidase domain
MESDKILTKNIPKILAQNDSNQFENEFFYALSKNLIYLLLYALTMFLIEMIGKLAIRNAINGAIKQLLFADLSTISKKEYERQMTSVVHHGENVTSAIRNIFIEFPRKVISCYHFLHALEELSWEIMIYCTFSSFLFVMITIVISFVRKYMISKIVESNVNISIICSDLSNSIQSYKIDNREEEYQKKIDQMTKKIFYYSSTDSLMIASTEAMTSFSSQFMLGLISYLCRPLVLSKTISLEDLMYGVKSSSKLIEKMIGVVEYFGDVIRQYQSFYFFTVVKNIIQEEVDHTLLSQNPHILSVTRSVRSDPIEYLIGLSHFIRLSGTNGVGKTTCLLKFMGVSYKGATTTGSISAINHSDHRLLPHIYRNIIGFVQQNVPLTHDCVEEYILKTANSQKSFDLLCRDMMKFFGISKATSQYLIKFLSEITDRSIRELSGGQAKMIQIIAALAKLFEQNGLILILDEPSNNLDIEKVSYVKEMIDQCLVKGLTIFIVTHDQRMVTNVKSETIELTI